MSRGQCMKIESAISEQTVVNICYCADYSFFVFGLCIKLTGTKLMASLKYQKESKQ